MSKVFYFDCSSGISGDMTVAALLDLGADREKLMRMLSGLKRQGVGGFDIKISRVKKTGMDACDFDVVLDKQHDNHDHEMAWLHASAVHDAHYHEHEKHVHEHCEGHAAAHGHMHEHIHRSLPDIIQIIKDADMTANAKTLATRMFTIIAEAEAKAHGASLDDVHFHEVGAVDSIADILSVAVCADDLGMESAIIPWLHEGEGMIRCQHGMIPVPVPAVTAIAERYGLVLRPAGIKGELVTPTGAAIAACFGKEHTLPKAYRIVKTGIGAGKRDYGLPGILRVMLLEVADDASSYPSEEHTVGGDCTYADDSILKLETDIDDCSGEILGYCMEQLFLAGAKDVHFVPIFMKKNRPGYQLQVICTRASACALEEIIFRETTTIGIRRIPVERVSMQRRIEWIDTAYGKARVKICERNGLKKIYPEYEDAASMSRKHGISLAQAYAEISKKAQQI